MKPSTVLELSKARIADPANWTVKYSARDKELNPVGYYAKTACKFCAVGSMDRTRFENGNPVGVIYYAYLTQAANKLGYGTASVLNDAGNHTLVMRMYDIAIELARKDEE